MITIKRTNSDDPNFQELVKLLDLELQERDGEEHVFLCRIKYNQHPKLCRCGLRPKRSHWLWCTEKLLQ